MLDSLFPVLKTSPATSVGFPESDGTSDTTFTLLDRLLHAQQARFTGSLSPAALLLAYWDWWLHLANAPGRRLELARAAVEQWSRLAMPKRWAHPLPQDRRFHDEAWSHPPFDMLAQSFLLCEEWWGMATAGLPGVAKSHADVVSFTARQILDVFAPTNFACTNPEVLRATMAKGGMNFLAGLQNLARDISRAASGKMMEGTSGLQVGRDLAITPGQVVFQNELMELIQYSPTTKIVRPEPILIVPAWIMKFYILDLTPQDSLIHYLVSQGFTVFCMSWVNPDPELRDTTLDDYRRLGVMAALDVIGTICGNSPVQACGYCLGGTLLAITAAAMARDGDTRLASVTFLAAQVDFTEAGELQLFTDESQLALLDDVMWMQGYLDSGQMAGAFQMLRSNDLIWSQMIRSYLLGEREEPNDLMAWNADATRMPYRMHAEYLRRMFLDNDLAEGRIRVDGRTVSVSDIQVPIFAVGTETDHVAPWRSVYKIHLLNHSEITFVLTAGGHNAGIVSEPGHPRRHFRIATRLADGPAGGPDEWISHAALQEGSWWSAWSDWLGVRSGAPVDPPAIGSERFPPRGPAPGTYIHQH